MKCRYKLKWLIGVLEKWAIEGKLCLTLILCFWIIFIYIYWFHVSYWFQNQFLLYWLLFIFESIYLLFIEKSRILHILPLKKSLSLNLNYKFEITMMVSLRWFGRLTFTLILRSFSLKCLTYQFRILKHISTSVSQVASSNKWFTVTPWLT